ncbi:YciI family protein [Altererythrobacter sp. GH1-8]|uniref:YciI family protein n=1 Tax=Altererythrobacter sp. GH1-8 TaxID=3349333 RepID=UPI00374D5BBA
MSEILFAIIAYDNPDSDAARVEHREGHLSHFKAHAAQIAVAGPMVGEKSGSLVIYNAENAEEARAFIEADPFHAAGVWGSIEVMQFKAATGTWAS